MTRCRCRNGKQPRVQTHLIQGPHIILPAHSDDEFIHSLKHSDCPIIGEDEMMGEPADGFNEVLKSMFIELCETAMWELDSPTFASPR